ncbi:hypothetical protein T07_3533, partial [Trichinella nelsoni]
LIPKFHLSSQITIVPTHTSSDSMKAPSSQLITAVNRCRGIRTPAEAV